MHGKGSWLEVSTMEPAYGKINHTAHISSTGVEACILCAIKPVLNASICTSCGEMSLNGQYLQLHSSCSITNNLNC